MKYEHDLSSAAQLGQAVQKFPPNMKEAWSMHTVKNDWSLITLLDFNDWLKDKAEAHERMKISTTKPKNDESEQSVTRTKTGAKGFAVIKPDRPSKDCCRKRILFLLSERKLFFPTMSATTQVQQRWM